MRSIGLMLLPLAAATLCAQQPDSARLASRPGLTQYSNEYASAAGLPDLEVGPHRAGDREIRVWIGFGITLPDDMYRIIEHHGQYRGEYVRAWSLHRDAPLPDTSETTGTGGVMRWYHRGRCSAIRRGAEAEVCIARFTSPPPWRAIWHTIDTAGVWTLPDESTLEGGRDILDGWAVVVETWDGHSYRAWSYSNPELQPWPQAKQAAAIAHAFDGIARLVPLSDREERIRGKAIVRGDSVEFWNCDGLGPWLVMDGADSLRAASHRADSTQPAAVQREFYFEARTIEAPAFLLPFWSVPSKYIGVFDPDSTIVVEPWQARRCSK